MSHYMESKGKCDANHSRILRNPGYHPEGFVASLDVVMGISIIGLEWTGVCPTCERRIAARERPFEAPYCHVMKDAAMTLSNIMKHLG